MAKKPTIVVLFGTSGSGKSFVCTELANDPHFEHIEKYSTRKMRSFAGDGKKDSIKAKATYYGFSVITEDDIRESDIHTVNYGHDYCLPVTSVDNCMVRGKVPVVILRTREQFERLEEVYPDAVIKKFYIRPNAKKLREKLLADSSRSEQETNERLEKVESDYDYHDETARLDDSVVVLEHTYDGADKMVDAIVSNLEAEGLLPNLEEIAQNEEMAKNQIVLGDKVRISYEYGDSGKNVWHAKVIENDRFKFNLKPQENLLDLIIKIQKLCGIEPSKNTEEEKQKIDEIAELFNILTKHGREYQKPLVYYSECKLVEMYGKEMSELTNSHKSLKNGELVLPSFVIDVDVTHLGFDFKISELRTAWGYRYDDYDRDYKIRHLLYHPIGYRSSFVKSRESKFDADSFYNAFYSQIFQPFDAYPREWENPTRRSYYSSYFALRCKYYFEEKNWEEQRRKLWEKNQGQPGDDED